LNFAEFIAYAHSKLDFAVSQKKAHGKMGLSQEPYLANTFFFLMDRKTHGKMVLRGTRQTLFFLP
jgi:hypothetical protein